MLGGVEARLANATAQPFSKARARKRAVTISAAAPEMSAGIARSLERRPGARSRSPGKTGWIVVAGEIVDQA